MKELNELGQWLVDYAKGELKLYVKKRRKHTTGKLGNSLYHRTLKSGNLFKIELGSRSGYGKFVHFGRRPGKFPPPPAILKWMEKKPIRLQDKKRGGFIKNTPENRRQVAFLIGRKIKEQGIEAFPYFTRSLEASKTKAKPIWERVIKEQIKFYFSGN